VSRDVALSRIDKLSLTLSTEHWGMPLLLLLPLWFSRTDALNTTAAAAAANANAVAGHRVT
jgi:hypothetical protein